MLTLRDIAYFLFTLLLWVKLSQSISGIHSPLPISPKVDIADNLWLLDLYYVLLDREQDAEGYRVNLQALQFGGDSRGDVYNSFVYSQEFQSNPSLQDKSLFVSRLYERILKRSPSDVEVQAQVSTLKAYDGTGLGRTTWLQEIDNVYYSDEYKQNICQTGYYSFNAAVNEGELLLGDMFNGRARMQPQNESELVALQITSAKNIWDQKLSIFKLSDGGYVAFTRSYIQEPNTFTVTMLTGDSGGLKFTEVGILWQPKEGHTFYDPHISIDSSVCPPRYVMAMECIGNYYAASLCVSSTTTPSILETWLYPEVLVDGLIEPAAQSASTGVLLTDGFDRFVSWTQVYDGTQQNDPQAHTYSQSAPVKSFYDSFYFGSVDDSRVNVMMPAEPEPWCTSSWDCNNRDKQDWKREGDYFYALYNGANYYRCDGTWGLSIARSKKITGEQYTERLPISFGILADRSDTCGTSYIMLNVIEGVPYLYYAFVQLSGANEVRRSRIVPI